MPCARSRCGGLREGNYSRVTTEENTFSVLVSTLWKGVLVMSRTPPAISLELGLDCKGMLGSGIDAAAAKLGQASRGDQ
jgi:hypothetical protein